MSRNTGMISANSTIDAPRSPRRRRVFGLETPPGVVRARTFTMPPLLVPSRASVWENIGRAARKLEPGAVEVGRRTGGVPRGRRLARPTGGPRDLPAPHLHGKPGVNAPAPGPVPCPHEPALREARHQERRLLDEPRGRPERRALLLGGVRRPRRPPARLGCFHRGP